jgi:hypothetical protein
MTPLGPRPQSVQELAGSLLAALLTADRREVRAPPWDERVQRHDPLGLPSRLVVSPDFSRLALMAVTRLRAGLDDGLEAEPSRAYRLLTEVAPQELKAPRS